MKLNRGSFARGLRCIAGALALLAPLGAAHAADDWTTEERTAFATSTVLLVADWAQTRQIARNASLYRETNPILGAHPSMGNVNTYFASTLLLNYAIGRSLGSGWRRTWFIGVGAVEAGVVRRNLSIGLQASF